MKLNKQLLPFARPRHTGVVPNTFVMFGSEDENCLRQDGNYETGQYIGKDDRTIYERYLGLMMDIGKIIKIGEPLTLLLTLIRKCGKDDTCVANYATLAEECQVSISTIKGWGNKLEELGFINKQVNGPHGLTFTLNNECIGKSDLFQRIDQQLSQSADQIKASMVVVDNALRQALASVLFKTGEN